MRELLRKIRRAFLSGTLISHYVLNKGFRVSVSLLVSLILNISYLVFNLISGIIYSSPAFIAVSVYYALHICIRYTILNFSAGTADDKTVLTALRKGGIMLLIADALITPMLIFGAFEERIRSYSSPVLIFLAAYAAYTLVSAAAGMIISKRDNYLMRRAAYSVRLASGAVSGFNLASALVSAFTEKEACVKIGIPRIR